MGIISAYKGVDKDNAANVVCHYGTPRHSGRYPWGSGDNPYQHESWFMQERKRLKEMGITSEKELAEHFNMTQNEYRKRVAISRATETELYRKTIEDLYARGYNKSEIGRIIGKNESFVRDHLKNADGAKNTRTTALADQIAKEVDANGITDVGKGTELYLGVTQNRLNTALAMLEDRGYTVMNIKVPQATNPDQKTSLLVIAPKDIAETERETKAYIYDQVLNQGNLNTITSYSPNGGKDFNVLRPIESVDSKRVYIRYTDDPYEDGANKEGVIEIRSGVDDLTLGNSHYAQVRIGVDDKYYMKGMAIYSDDIPEGYDIVFNTKKQSSVGPEGAFKKMKDDPNNPFGALIKANGQTFYKDDSGKYVESEEGSGIFVPDDGTFGDRTHYNISAINKIKEEGDWDSYSKSLASQMLSKQSAELIKKQLDLSYDLKNEEFESIKELTNPVVKRNMLKEFADECDSAAVDLKAAALPGQQSRVILPVTSLADNEVYAPTYPDGTKVVLIRYPHGGLFEIPELKVNNKSAEGAKVVGPDSKDAIGINLVTADKLSGADFDGDSVVVIPVNSKTRIMTAPKLKDMIGWTPEIYAKSDDELPTGPKVTKEKNADGSYKIISGDGFNKQQQMGSVTNLITDMTLKGADFDEIAKATKHSMVVIDAEKHNYDWRQSEIDNDIKALKDRYQDGGGASTIISQASSELRVPKRKQFNYAKYNDYTGGIDPETGEKKYKETGETKPVYKKDPSGAKVYKYDDEGNIVKEIVMKKTTRMAETTDAYTLVSKTQNHKEILYADYANKLKKMGNDARKEFLATKSYEVDKGAKEAYSDEIASLKQKLETSKKNAPKERAAQVSARAVINATVKENPDIRQDKDAYKKLCNKAINNARDRYGAKRYAVDFTEREWEAVQAHAISPTTLDELLKKADSAAVKKLATPKKSANELTTAQLNVMQSMRNSGYTIAEIADRLGCSSSTVSKNLS